MALFLLEILVRRFGKSMPSLVSINGRFGWAIMCILLIFGVIRNIPYWPFTELAPSQKCVEK
jgi:hypothetical protein